ncbi:DUF4376 domain-containing protein [Pseudomonas tohonis]|uniref:DUF4376 domain-containing protein n=1 Tax=Pseudomonas tohonis TaxID=2725477 RepID=UPI001F2830FE|nr:DUF4376 domain-containing protein [Pseudomonas tohonis]
MSFAIRKDNQGQRAINDPSDVGADEYFSEFPIEIVPTPTSALVDAERDRRIESGIKFNGVNFQSRAADRENVSSAAQLALMAIGNGAEAENLRWLDPDNDFCWIASDNSLVPMDAQTVFELGRVFAVTKQHLIFAARKLKSLKTIPADFADDKWWE